MDAPGARHPSDQALLAHGLGRLDGRSAGSVGRHLDSCPDCRRRAATLSAGGSAGRDRGGRLASDSALSAPAEGTAGVAAHRSAATAASIGDIPPGLAEHSDYEILRELGRGGMGVVYLARNKLMGREEVLKVVGGHLLDRGQVRERFLREIRSAAQLNHPNVVTAYAAVWADDQIVLAMEYVDGSDLAKLVERAGPLPVAQACHFAYQAALGLQHAHERGMVHRDIKPGNLMLARRGNRATVKILDFGLAKATQEAPIEGGLTREGQMLGTPDYIAPEQTLDAQKADIRADIYSLGCTLYHLLTGGPPFRANSLYEILQAHHSRYATPLNLARPEVPAELAALVEMMMAKSPSDRFQTPAAVAQALKPFFRPGEAGAIAGGGRGADPGAVTVDRGTPGVVAAVSEAGRPAAPASSPDAIGPRRREAPSSDRIPAGAGKGVHPAWLWAPVGAGALLLSLIAIRGLVGDAARQGAGTPPAPSHAAHPADGPPRVPEPPRPEQTIAPASPRPEAPPRSVARQAVPSGGGAAPRRGGRGAPPAEPPPAVAPPAGAVAEVARAGDRAEAKATTEAGNIRHLALFAGRFRPANRDAEMPTTAFWPIAKPDDMSAWQVGDPGRLEMDRDGVTLSAGPAGNLLLTRKAFRRRCSLKLTLSAAKGTEAFLALRAHRGPDGWKAVTARVYDEGGRIHAGYHGADFQVAGRGAPRESFEPGKAFVVRFQVDDRDVATLRVASQSATSIAHARTAVAAYEGGAGVFVKAGTLVIHTMDVQD